MVDDFNDGHDTSMDSKYYLPPARIGSPTGVQTANQIAELGLRLNEGVKNVEVGAIDPNLFEAIPKQHFGEMRRLSKLAKAETSVHAPIIDLCGFTQQGWDESQRVAAEKQAMSIIERAHQLNPDGNIPVTFHISQAPANFWQKNLKKGEKLAMGIVNQDTGQINMVKYEEKEYFGEEDQEHKIWTPERRLENMNHTQWDQEKLQILDMQKKVEEIRERQMRYQSEIGVLETGYKQGVLSPEEEQKYLATKQEINALQGHIDQLHGYMRSGFQEIYNKFEKFSDKESDSYIFFKNRVYPEMQKTFEVHQREIKDKINKLNHLKSEANRLGKTGAGARAVEEFEKNRQEYLKLTNQQTENLLRGVERMEAPEVWKPIDDFALEKVSKTVSSVSFEAFKKHGEKAPTIVLENFAPELPLSRADSLKEAVFKSREEFAKKLVDERRISEAKAKEIANKLIGATWDLGHINQLRKGGFTEKEIEEETKRIAKSGVVKHVHIADNFGFADSHLPSGMGEIDNKRLIEELEKGGFKGKAIMEAGQFAVQFKESPMPYALEGMGSPLYSLKSQPYWGNIRELQGAYYGGMGPIMPQQHFDMYGASWSTMPLELGGQMPGKQSRFAGAPME